MLSSKVSQPHRLRHHHVVKRQAVRGAGVRRHLAVVNVAADQPAAAGPSDTATSPVAVLKEAAFNASVAPKLVLQAMVELEKQKVPVDDCVDYLTKPGSRWKLVYAIPAKAVIAAYKGDKSATGFYFPIPACQKFDKDPSIFTQGVFLGGLAYMIFAGPFEKKGQRKLEYDVTFMTLGVGPFKATIPMKDGAFMGAVTKSLKSLPFLMYAYADEDIIMARGASGGLALWVASDSEWQAKSGVLRVMQ